MKTLVHFHFSFLLKIENNFTTHVSKFIFHFFGKTKMMIFRFLFSNFEKKWKFKFNEFIFQLSKKKINGNLFLSLLFNFGKNENFANSFFNFLSMFLPLLLSWQPCAQQDPGLWCLQRKQALRDWHISVSRSLIKRQH